MGSGSTGAAGVPVLFADGLPVIGGALELRVDGGTPNAPGALLYGPKEIAFFLPAFGATFYTGFPLFSLGFALDSNGSSPSLASITPIDASLCGQQFISQAVLVDQVAMGALSFTQGLRLRFGIAVGPVLPGAREWELARNSRPQPLPATAALQRHS